MRFDILCFCLFAFEFFVRTFQGKLANHTYKLIKLSINNILASKIFSENVIAISIKSKFRLK